MPPPSDQLNRFMAAIRLRESSNNYQAMGQDRGSRYGVARGAYQIMSEIWPGWAREAGYGGAQWNDPRAQDAVASYMMTKYYNRYGGDWGLVAAAWFGGTGAADRAQAAGMSTLAGVNDDGNSPGSGINVPTYVRNVLASMASMSGDGGQLTPVEMGVHADPSAQTPATVGGLNEQMGSERPPKRQAADVANGVMSVMMRIMQANPEDPAVHEKTSSAFQRLYRQPGTLGEDSTTEVQ